MITAIGIFLAVYLAISVLAASLAMDIPRVPLGTASPESDGLAFQDVSFDSCGSEPVTLKGWFLPGTNGRVVTVLNGGFRNRVDTSIDTLALARDLVQRGYNVLLFDFRGRGESGGRGQTLSFIDQDVSPFNTVYGSIKHQARIRGLPGAVFTFLYPGAATAARILYGFKQTDPIDVIGKVKSPLLIIHETGDNFQTIGDAQSLLTAGKPEDQLLIVPGAHSDGYVNSPGAYIDKVVTFLDGTLK